MLKICESKQFSRVFVNQYYYENESSHLTDVSAQPCVVTGRNQQTLHL
jgi:hypothetical protein